MVVVNKRTGQDVSHEYLGLMKGLITREEFNTITGIGNMMLKSRCEISDRIQ
jgi:hypothetical protein